MTPVDTKIDTAVQTSWCTQTGPTDLGDFVTMQI